MIAGMVALMAMAAASCSNKKPEKAVDKQRKTPAAQGTPINKNKKEAAPIIPGNKEDIVKLLGSIPCKLEGKMGVIVVFPDNTQAGQNCFSLVSLRNDPKKGLAPIDIKDGKMIVFVHQPSDVDPSLLKLVTREKRDNAPCVEKSCSVELESIKKVYIDPAKEGWFYLVMTPAKPVDVVSGNSGYYGVTVSGREPDEIFTPFFY